MFMTSTTVASLARDCIPSSIADLYNLMCLFVLTRGDGTPFHASSMLEEHIIEICIWSGHTHPEGVLWHSTIELVMLFYTVDELQIVRHRVMKALMLHDGAIRVRTLPPSVTHVRAYMAVVGGEPSCTQPPPSNGEEEPIYPPATPTLVGESHNTCKQALGILQIMNCASSWRISAGRLHSKS